MSAKEEKKMPKVDFRDYYSMIRNQQNMLEDHVRTGTYQTAILQNRTDFAGKVVLDVGAGSGILSMFAAQAGAKRVYAVEASEIAEHAEALVKGNNLGHIVQVVKGDLASISLPEPVDVIISEPIGVLLVHERMLETYVRAKQLFLKPGGMMFPNASTIKVCPFSDPTLYLEQQAKAAFWKQEHFYGLSMQPLRAAAEREHFSQPVVGAFDPAMLMARSTVDYQIDYLTSSPEDLHSISIPFDFVAATTNICHGLATWFDADFCGTDQHVVLCTGPHAPVTHWQQCRILLQQPLAVNAGQRVCGTLQMDVNDSLSYNMTLTMCVGGPDGVKTVQHSCLHNQLYRYAPQLQTVTPSYSSLPPSQDTTNSTINTNNYTNNYDCGSGTHPMTVAAGSASSGAAPPLPASLPGGNTPSCPPAKKQCVNSYAK